MSDARLRRGLLGASVAVAAVVVWRAFSPVPHTGGDNAGYVSLAHGLLTTGAYTDVFDPAGLPHTKYPPVYPALLALLISLGARTWVALKLSAAVPTVLTVGLTYLWAERKLGVPGGFAVALLVALATGMVYYSHWILSDPLFVTLTLLSLVCLGRVDEAWGRRAGNAEHGGGEDEDGGVGRAWEQAAWLAGGVTAAGLAYFTRSAGLPLLVALFGWLALRRRWRAIAVSGAVLGLPVLAWWLRGRGEGVGQYSVEFWLVDPYDPARGTIGVLGLVPRVLENLSAYTLRHVPGGIVGADAAALAPLGVAISFAALAGWVISVRERVGPLELFFPLYAGLILVWPTVWGGDRFALPLFPFLFFYAALALRTATSNLPSAAGRALGAVLFLALLLPASADWLESSRQNALCARAARDGGAWACYGARIGYYVQAATWTGSGLPEGSVVLTRKPRHFYLLSGHPSRTFTFSDDPSAHLALADSVGARYVLLDQWDGLAARYVGSAVRGMPGAFCYVRGFGRASEGGSQLLGILAPEGRGTGPGDGGIRSCPPAYSGVSDGAGSYSPSGRIPLLEGLDS